MRVMHLISNLDMGGAQEVVRTLTESLAEAGHLAVVCSFQDGPLRQPIERKGIPVFIIPEKQHSVTTFHRFLLELFRIRRELAALVDRYEIDVIQTHLLRSMDFVALSLRFRRNLLVFWTFHNVRFGLREDHLASKKWLLKPKRFVYRWMYRLGSRWVNGLIAVSQDVKAAILQKIGGVPEHKVAVILNSVDLTRYQIEGNRAVFRQQLGLTTDDHVISVVANFKKQKGHSFLIDSVPIVLSRFPKLHVLLIGDGAIREELEDQTRGLGLEKHIHFLGIRQDVPKLLAASDCFVLPSLWDGLAMALIEAMASGLPIVATEVSGAKQVMVPGETGLVVPPGDSALLADALIEILSNPDRARAMGIASRQRIQKQFSARTQVNDYIVLYQRERARAGWRANTSVEGNAP